MSGEKTSNYHFPLISETTNWSAKPRPQTTLTMSPESISVSGQGIPVARPAAPVISVRSPPHITFVSPFTTGPGASAAVPSIGTHGPPSIPQDLFLGKPCPDVYQNFPQAPMLQGSDRKQTGRVPTLSTLSGAAVMAQLCHPVCPPVLSRSSSLGYLLEDKLRSDTLRCVFHSTLLALSSLTPAAAAGVWTTPPNSHFSQLEMSGLSDLCPQASWLPC